MIQITHVLCPVDFSAFSQQALAHAAQIARWYDAPLTVLHAYAVGPPPVLLGGLPGPLPVEPLIETNPSEFAEAALAELKRFTAATDTSGVNVRLETYGGNAVRGILSAAATLHADLIVLGTHGHGGFERLVLGSVTEKVLRKAACPVLTVPPQVAPQREDAAGMFKRILCPIDFSESSMKALRYGLSLAQEADAELLLLHVIEGMPDLKDWRQPNVDIAEYLRTSEERALADMRAAVPEEARTWCHPRELLTTGKSYEAILKAAAEHDVRLIVMGVHGRSPVDLLLGSTTDRVVRMATCPVLTLRADGT